jgi:hypothetical protein
VGLASLTFLEKEARRMIESLALKEEQHQAEGLTLEELEGQTVELLPNRIEMRRRRRTVIIIINKCNNSINVNIAGSQCN